MQEELNLTSEYWSARYQSGQTGWDAGAVTTPLKSYIDQLEDKEIKILIPGGGNGYEAEYLHRNGFSKVHLLDFASEPLQNFASRVPDFPKEHLLQKDFFDMENEQYDLVLEQTFFCALPRGWRSNYARQVFQVLKPNGKLAGVLFSTEFDRQGPPFGGSAFEYQAYFEPYFHFRHFEPCYNSIEPRQGREIFMVLQRKERPQFMA
ncbi:methyltransferase domain-containing protein [Rufibacter roseus]|uniref:Methyltransferase domain-containing protein n=1 Tax=Rufibacter roseus TaxID=1567108 RepID=A0ABW2DQL6_9BACT|nr:methyltransferase domain-containing protein [Rufibacter roseus]